MTHPRLFTLETRVVICATVALAILAVSLLLGFISNRALFWWLAKVSKAVAAGCAVVLVILNVIMHG